LLDDVFNRLLADLCIRHGIVPTDGIPLEIVEEFNLVLGEALSQARVEGKIGDYTMVAIRDSDRMEININVNVVGKIEHFDVEFGVGTLDILK
jgi:hypothetical protein